jgi:hypothetical protein
VQSHDVLQRDSKKWTENKDHVMKSQNALHSQNQAQPTEQQENLMEKNTI